MTANGWIRNKLNSGISRGQLYMIYKQFKKDTKSNSKYDSYIRSVRKIDNELRSQKILSESIDPRKQKESIEKEISEDTLKINATLIEVNTLDDLIKRCEIDTNIWVPELPVKFKQWQMGYKDANGEGKIMQLSSVHAKFVTKASLEDVDSIDEKKELERLIEDAKKYAPKYPKLPNIKKKSGNLLEISLFDHHFGQLSWGEETGDKNYNLKIAYKMAIDAITDILNQAKNYEIDQVIIVIGNDFFNVNDKTNTTVKGTPQSEDDRWQKTFLRGRDLWIEILELCRSVSPTKALWIPGNHDEERSFELCVALDAWFHNSDIEVDISPKAQKVVTWGNTSCFYSHGCNENPNDYPMIFASMFPQEFANAKYRTCHLADKHHIKKKGFIYHDDIYGVDVKIKPSLVPLNAWSSGKAYKAIARTEAEIWNKKDGLIADLYHNA